VLCCDVTSFYTLLILCESRLWGVCSFKQLPVHPEHKLHCLMQVPISACWQGTARLVELPPYLTVQMVRFFYRADVQQKAKILRKVSRGSASHQTPHTGSVGQVTQPLCLQCSTTAGRPCRSARHGSPSHVGSACPHLLITDAVSSLLMAVLCRSHFRWSLMCTIIVLRNCKSSWQVHVRLTRTIRISLQRYL